MTSYVSLAIAVTGIWIAVVLVVRRSVSPNCRTARRIIAISGALTACLLLVVSLVAGQVLTSTVKVERELALLTTPAVPTFSESTEELTVYLIGGQRARVDGATMPIAALIDALQPHASKHTPPLITIAAKETTDYEDVTQVLNMCSQMGLKNVTFTLLDLDDEP